MRFRKKCAVSRLPDRVWEFCPSGSWYRDAQHGPIIAACGDFHAPTVGHDDLLDDIKTQAKTFAAAGGALSTPEGVK
jgi:hypothetical protein